MRGPLRSGGGQARVIWVVGEYKREPETVRRGRRYTRGSQRPLKGSNMAQTCGRFKASAADLKFLHRLPQTRLGTSNRKAALAATLANCDFRRADTFHRQLAVSDSRSKSASTAAMSRCRRAIRGPRREQLRFQLVAPKLKRPRVGFCAVMPRCWSRSIVLSVIFPISRDRRAPRARGGSSQWIVLTFVQKPNALGTEALFVDLEIGAGKRLRRQHFHGELDGLRSSVKPSVAEAFTTRP
jgi:hypothetical protein